jgi:hypothetical protein
MIPSLAGRPAPTRLALRSRRDTGSATSLLRETVMPRRRSLQRAVKRSRWLRARISLTHSSVNTPVRSTIASL